MIDNENIKGVCNRKLCEPTLEIINRQKAEIERLHSMNQAKLNMLHDIRAELEIAKSEAIREFAERLKVKAAWDDKDNTVVHLDDIDSVVKEMTEGEK